MAEPTITCPKCGAEIKLTESLAAPLIESTRKQYQAQLEAKDTEVAKREATLREEKASLAKAREAIDEQVAERLAAERSALVAAEAKKAKLAVASELEQKAEAYKELEAALAQNNAKLAEAQKAQAELVRKERELADARREMDLTIEKQVSAGLATAREAAKREAEEGLKLKVAEKDHVIASMQQQIEELKRRSEQGSQQLQGEVQELELESLLREKFPLDGIEPVPKGVHGGDTIQGVTSPTGQPCGTILWESKRTKHWTAGWLSKVREDQRASKAEVAVIVSQVLPEGCDTFDYVDGVWVTSWRCMVPVAIALRQSLIELGAARSAGEGQQTKMELVYQYLTGPRFRHRVQAIVEKFSDMQEDLEKERKTMTRLWAKREEQIRGVIESTAGMYGDLQGIAGKSLPEVEGLALPEG